MENHRCKCCLNQYNNGIKKPYILTCGDTLYSDGFFDIRIKNHFYPELIIIRVKKDYTIKKLKEIIVNQTGKVMSSFDLIFKKPLNDESTLESYGITNSVTLICITVLTGGGGFGLNTIEVSKNNTKIIEFDDNAPFYRTVGNGLSIQAICGNEYEAKDK